MIVTRTRNATVPDVLGATDVSIADRPSPLKPFGAPEAPGFLESFGLSFKTNSITGTAGGEIHDSLFGPSNERDDSFNPYDLMTDDFAQKYPFMLRHFESGRVLDLPNSASFHYFLARQEEDYNDRQRLAGGSFIGTLAGAIGPDVGLYAVTGAIGKLSGVSPQIAAWLAKGNAAVRATKYAALGSVANVGNEGLLEFINPDRNVDEKEAFLTAAVWGAGIGAVLPIGGKLFGAGREGLINTSWGRNLQTRVAKTIATSKPIANLAEIAKASDAELDTLLTETPSGTKVIGSLKTAGSAKKIAALEQRYVESGHKLTVQPHPYQDYADAVGGLDDLDSAMGVSLVTDANGNTTARAAGPDMIEPVIQGRFGQFGAILSSFLPGGKARAMPSGVARFLNYTLFDDAAMVLGNVVDAVDFTRNPSAEALKPGIQLLHARTEQAIGNSFNSHFKAGGQAIAGTLSDGTQLNAGRWFGFRQFREAAIDLVRQESEIKRGARTSLTFEPPAAVREAAEHVRQYSRDMLDRLDQAQLLRGPRALAAAQKELAGLQAAQKAVSDEVTALDAATPTGPRVEPRRATKSTKGFQKAYKQRLAALEAVNPGAASNKADAVELAKQDLQNQFDAAAKQANAEIDAHAAKMAEAAPRKAKADEAAKAKETEVKEIEDLIANADNYVTRRWLKHKIEGNKDRFTGLLKSQWQRNRQRDFKTNAPLAERPIIVEALDRLDPEDRAVLRQLGTIQADDGLAARYETAVDEYFTASAEGVYKELTDLNNAHGVPVIIKTPAPLKGRVLQIDETAFREFLDQDAQSILGHYDQQLSGRIAVRIAIENSRGEWAPVVKALLNEEFDGSVDQLIRASNAHFDNLLNAAADDAARAKIKTAQKNMGLIVERKISELEGRPPLMDNGSAAEAGWRAVGRSLLRMPYMAMMGLQTVTNLMDLAGVVLMTGLDSRKIKLLASQFQMNGWLPTMSKRGLEAVASALDQTGIRQMELNEVFEHPHDSAPATTLGGRMAQGLDRGTAFIAQQFGRVTGINWLNATTRRMAGHLVLDLVVDGTRRMSKASKLMDELGIDQATAFHRVGLAVEDAQRLSRLGFSAAESDKLIDVLMKHATDADGNRPWQSAAEPRAAFMEFQGHVLPEYHAWYHTERAMFDRFTSAINSEVDNMIVRPKTLSRPFMNARWLGRAVNQFWGFAYAWSNQLAIATGQRPGMQQAGYLMSLIGLGAMTDSIHNHLTGRRSFDETAGLWSDPKTSMAMLYGAVDRAGVLGWLSRPLGIADREGFGPGSALGGDGVSSRYLGNVKGRLGYLAPAGDYLDKLAAGLLGAPTDGSRKSWHMLRQSLPFQNLLHIQAVYRFTKDAGLPNPIGPGRGVDPFLLPTKPLNDPADRTEPPTP